MSQKQAKEVSRILTVLDLSPAVVTACPLSLNHSVVFSQTLFICLFLPPLMLWGNAPIDAGEQGKLSP